MAIDRMAHIRIKIDRAKKHLRDLDSKFAAFVQSGAYEVIRDEDTDPQTIIYRVRVHRELPLCFGAIAGDALHNLRTALDFLVHQLILANGETPTFSTEFPIMSSAKKFEKKFRPKVKGVRQEAVDLIKAAKPYKDGTDLFFTLHKLDIRDKHHLLLLSAGSTLVLIRDPEKSRALNGRLGGGSMGWSMHNVLRPGALIPHPVEDNAELCRIDRADMDVYPEPAYFITFGEPEIVKGQPILSTITQLIDLVEGFVKPFGPLLV